ncbi:CBS domain-containing protein [Roseibium aquae]|uniref:CBS domain-containing protein n=1 Tax=Roseibium aquae TaxID=1323746 RepID=UPI00123DF4C7
MSAQNTTNTVTPSAPHPASGAGGQDSEDPQQRKPRSNGSLLTRLKRLFGLAPGTNLRENLEDELARDSGNASFSPEERLLLSNILRLRELRVDDVMIPRANIDAVDSSTTLGELMDRFRESGHSRMPVYVETLDDPRGMVHIKDLMAYIAECGGLCPAGGMGQVNGHAAEPASEETAETPVLATVGHNSARIELGNVNLSIALADTGLIRDLLFVPPSMPATDLMAKMQAGRIQMALVIDEYGGTDGLVSLEDLVEEVVGDIEDEHDEDEDAMLEAVGDGMWMADPRIPIEELDEALGTDIAAGDIIEEVDTLGGLLYVTAGRVPVRGELLFVPQVSGFEFEILDADPRRIKRLRIRRRRLDPRATEIRRRSKRPEDEGAPDPSTEPAPAEPQSSAEAGTAEPSEAKAVQQPNAQAGG